MRYKNKINSMSEQIPSYYTIQVNGQLMDLSVPKIMGILNVTPDSFYAGSRKNDEQEIAGRVRQIINEGGDIIDIGAYSTRPGAAFVSQEEEMSRLRKGLAILRKEAPDAIVSVDTFRADVAAMCVEEYGVGLINDIAAGEMDERMFETIIRLNVPYIMMHMKGTPQNMQKAPQYDDLRKEIILYFAKKIETLASQGVKDIIVDPGFGFGKTLAHNYELLKHLEDFKMLDRPVLVGVSRKSMIYKLLDSTPDDALNGTTVINTIALTKGAQILRVHDVKACAEAVKIFNSAHLHVITSVSEGNPTTIWEAMSYGVPTMSFDHCGMHDTICDKCGIRIPISKRYEDCVAALARNIDALIEHPERFYQLALGTINCAHRYTWEKREKFLNNLYDSLFQNK